MAQKRRPMNQIAGAAVSALLVATALAVAPLDRAVAQSDGTVAAEASAAQGDAVQIEADSMEINQETRRAVFTGNVDAVQGNVRMTADEMFVDYEEVPDGEGTKTDVTFIEARGNVVVVSKGQTVTAQWSRMDVRANTVVFGDDVTVTEGQSVIRGAKLEMDLDTGQSRVVGGRVQGTFFSSGN